jgi:hypothetical protein
VHFNGLAKQHQEIRQHDLVQQLHDPRVRNQRVKHHMLARQAHDTDRLGSFEAVPSETLILHVVNGLFDLCDGGLVQDVPQDHISLFF